MRGIVSLCGLLLSFTLPAQSASPSELVGRNRPSTEGYNSCLTAEMMNWSGVGHSPETVVSCLNKPNGDYLFHLSVGLTEDSMWGWVKYSELSGYHEMVIDSDCQQQKGGRFETQVSSPTKLRIPACWEKKAKQYRPQIDEVLEQVEKDI